MNRHCPSCGSQITDDTRECPSCGEILDNETAVSAPDSPTPQEDAPASPIPVTPSGMTSSPTATAPVATGTAAPRRKICEVCGASNAADATECAECGESLSAGDVRSTEAPPRPVRKRRSSAGRDYAIAFALAAAIGAGVWMAATPNEVKGPPEEQPMDAAHGELPANHPPMQQGPSPEQQQRIESLMREVEANPKNDSAKLSLANLLYDAKSFDQAVVYYQEYVQSHPKNYDARTDMAFSLLGMGRPDESIAELKRVVKEAPKHQKAQFHLAFAYLQKNNRDSVLYWLRETAAIDSTTPVGKDAIAILKQSEQ